MRIFISLTAVIATATFVYADRIIQFSGQQDGFYEQAQYEATEDIFVPKGDTLTFEAGSVIRFARFSGLKVLGTLVCRGTEGSTVVFTSASDSGDSTTPTAQPFDWNGIHVGPRGSVVLEYSTITFSTFGLECERETRVDLVNVAFAGNGRSDFSIGNKIIQVGKNMPFSYHYPAGILENTDTTGSSSVIAEQKQPEIRKIAVMRVASAAFTLVAAATTVVSYYLHTQYYNEALNETVNRSRAQRYESKSNAALSVAPVLGGLTGLGAASLGVSIVLPIRSRNAN